MKRHTQSPVVIGAVATRGRRAATLSRRAVRVSTLTVVSMAAVLLALAHSGADAAFERGVPPSAADAACGAGPPMSLVELLTTASPDPAWSVSVTSSELYGLSELAGTALSVGRRSPRLNLCATATSLGSELYCEQTLDLSASWSRSQTVAFELSTRALNLRWAGEGSEWSGAVDGSAAWLVGGRLVVGLSIRNLASASILTSPIAPRTAAGAALVLDGVTVLASLTGEAGFEPSPALGCELALTEWMRLRGGISAYPSKAALGLRFGSGRLRRPDVDLAWNWHPVLGMSYSLTVSIRI